MTGVDVVVPSYNYARYLEWCVGTLLSQQGVQVRVLIIDDASDDETSRIGQALAAGDSRVEFRRHESNAGHIATFNEGMIGWARAEYSLLISADDGLAPGALERATTLLSKHSRMGFAYGMATVITDHHGPPLEENPSSDARVVPGPRFVERCCSVGNPVPTPTAVVRTGTQQRLGGYRADLPHSADMEMWMRFALDGEVGVIRAVQGYYRWHGRNMSSGYYARRLSDRKERVDAFRPLEPRLRAMMPAFPAWFDAMRLRLGSGALRMAHEAFEEGDEAGYRECMAFAEEVHPSMRDSITWWKLQGKRLLGRRAVRWLRSAAGRPGGGKSPPEPRRTAGVSMRPGGSVGWWPDS